MCLCVYACAYSYYVQCFLIFSFPFYFLKKVLVMTREVDFMTCLWVATRSLKDTGNKGVALLVRS